MWYKSISCTETSYFIRARYLVDSVKISVEFIDSEPSFRFQLVDQQIYMKASKYDHMSVQEVLLFFRDLICGIGRYDILQSNLILDRFNLKDPLPESLATHILISILDKIREWESTPEYASYAVLMALFSKCSSVSFIMGTPVINTEVEL